jgi:peptide deformylase
MINPVIIWENKKYMTMEEGCLSLEGTRPARRSTVIEVAYQPFVGGKYKRMKIGGMHARVIQHEIDHTKGVLI